MSHRKEKMTGHLAVSVSRPYQGYHFGGDENELRVLEVLT